MRDEDPTFVEKFFLGGGFVMSAILLILFITFIVVNFLENPN
jgi:hypothetical protein